MQEVDVSPQLSLANVSPEEGGEAIANSKIVSVQPDMYLDSKKSLQPLVENAKAGSPTATPRVAEAMNSRAVASTIRPDMKKLSFAEKQMEFAKRNMTKGDTARRRNDAAWEVMMNGDSASDEAKFNLSQLQTEVNDEEQNIADLDLSFAETIPGEVANVGVDYYRGLRDNKEKAAAVLGIGTALGALGIGGAALVTGGAAIPAAGAGALIGGRLALPWALRATSFSDSVKQSAAGIYSELTFGTRDVTDENGKVIGTEPLNLPEGEKRDLALAAGVIVGTLDIVGETALIKSVPALAKLTNAKSAVKYLTKYGNEEVLGVVKNLGKSAFMRETIVPALTEGATEAIQEVVEKIATETGKRNVTDFSSFLDNIVNLDTLVQAAKAGTIGTVAGGSFVAAGKVASSAAKLDNRGAAVMTEKSVPVINSEPVRTSDIIQGAEIPDSIAVKGFKAVQLNAAIANIARATKDTKFKELAPEEFNELVRKQARDSKVSNLWVTSEDMNTWASDPDKQAKILAKIDPTGTLQPGLNAPIKIDTADAVELESEYPGFAGRLMPDPEGMTAEAYMNLLEERRTQAAELLGRTKASEQMSFDEEGNTVQNAPSESLSDLTPDNIIGGIGDLENLQNDQIIAGILGDQDSADSIIAQLSNNSQRDVSQQILLDTVNRVRDGLPATDVSQKATDDLILKKTLSETEQTELRARGDITLADLTRSKKDLTEQQLTDKIVTQERAGWVLKEIEAELEENQAIEEINRGAAAQTVDQIKTNLDNAGVKTAKLKDGRTLTITPITQDYLPRVELSVDGRPAGSIKFHIESKDGKKTTTPAMTQVAPAFRRQGVATAAYNTIAQEMLHFEHSNIQLPDGKAFAAAMKQKGEAFSLGDADNKALARQQRLFSLRDRLTGMIQGLPSYDDSRTRDIDVIGEESYLNQPTFTQSIQGVISDAEVTRANEALRSARQEVIESIDKQAELEMNQVVDLVTDIALQTELETRALEIENDENIKTVEAYLNNNFIGEPTAEMQRRAGLGQRVVQIDPKTLTDIQRGKYSDDVVLKKRDVFNGRTGMDALKAAKFFGFENVDTFLDVMSRTPDQATAYAEAAKVRGELRTIAEQNVDLNDAAISKSYRKVAETHLADMKLMKDKYWPTVRGLFKRIALPLPRINDLRIKANEKVEATQVKNLNVNQYKVGERKSQGKAVRDIVDMKVESAFRNKEAAALNAELARATHIAIGKVNRANKIMAKFLHPTTQERLEKAGKNYVNAGKLISDTFTVDNSAQRYNDFAAYNKFVEQQVKEGKPGKIIPAELFDKMARVHSQDLTVEEYTYLAGIAQTIMTQANMKNRLSAKWEKVVDTRNVTLLRDYVRTNLETHPEYDVSRPNEQLRKTATQKFLDGASRMTDLLKNVQFTVLKLDQGARDGAISKMIYDPLKGIGDFADGVNGELAAIELQNRWDKLYSQGIKEYGKADFNKMGVDRRTIPEFQFIKGLTDNEGKTTKLDIFMMAHHVGNEYNLNQLENYGVTREEFLAVIERELEPRDLDFIQKNVWDRYEESKPALRQLELDTKGTEPEWTEAREFTMFGKTYKGGHMGIRYNMQANSQGSIKQMKAYFANGESSKIIGAQDYEPLHGIVKSPHTKERVGGQYLIDLSPSTTYIGFNDMIYDLAMRRPVMEVRNILTDEKNALEFQRVLGNDQYNLLVNMVSETTRSQNSKQLQLFNDQKNSLVRMGAKAQAGAAVVQIAFGIRSLLIQADSMRQVAKVMGLQSGAKHLALTMSRFMNPTNWKDIGKFYDVVKESDPSIKSFFESVDMNGGFNELIPQISANRITHGIKGVRQTMADFAFNKMMGSVDSFMKVGTWHAAYSQYINGEAPRMPEGYTWKTSKEQLDRDAKAYASKVLSSALTGGTMLDRAVVQKLDIGQFIAYYYNDARNNINNSVADIRNMRNDLKEANRLIKEGDYDGAYKKFDTVGDTFARTLTLSILGLIFQGAVGGLARPGADDEEEKVTDVLPHDDESLLAYSGRMGYALGYEQIFQNVPVLRDWTWAGNLGMAPSSLLGRVGADATTAGIGASEAVYGMMNGLTLQDAMESISKKEAKAMARSFAIAAGGWPVNAPINYFEYLSEEGELPVAAMIPLALLKAGVDTAQDYIKAKSEANMTDEEKFQKAMELLDQGSGPSKKTGNKLVDDAQAFVDSTVSENKSDLTDDEYALIEESESQGKMVKNKTGSTAYGTWQFLEGTWKDIMQRAPQLGLTEEDRYDAEKQDIAMLWWTQDNIKQLKSLDVPINVVNVYGAHHYGPSGWAKIVKAPEDTSKYKVITDRVFNQNPYLKRKSIKTTGDIRNKVKGLLEGAAKKLKKKGTTVDVALD